MGKLAFALGVALSNKPESGLLECTGCGYVHMPEQRTRRHAQPDVAAPLVCSNCGCETYFKLDIMGKRIR